LFGAKITGGGCGGAVCVLASDTPEAQAAIERVRELFATKTGITDKPRVLHAAKATLAR
jgi:mevalonate kinase